MIKSIKSNIKTIMIGIGGAGINIINKAVSEQISEIEFVGIDTDEKALQLCNSPNIIQVEKSFASYFKSESEQKAVDDNVENIRELIKEADVVFICCGMGGEMGTEGSQVVAHIAKEMGILTIGIVTKPFRFESSIRRENAKYGIEELKKYTDTLFVITNDVILETVDKGSDLSEACSMINMLILHGILGINSLVDPNTINCKSLEQLCNIMKGNNIGHIGCGTTKRKKNLIETLHNTANSLWLENSIKESVQVMLLIYGDVLELDESDSFF